MMPKKEQILCIAALKQCMARGSQIVAFIAITDGELHGIWNSANEETISYLEKKYAESIIDGVETIAVHKTELPQ